MSVQSFREGRRSRSAPSVCGPPTVKRPHHPPESLVSRTPSHRPSRETPHPCRCPLPPLGFLSLQLAVGAGARRSLPPRAFNEEFYHAQAAEMSNSVKEAQEMLFYQRRVPGQCERQRTASYHGTGGGGVTEVWERRRKG